MKIFKLVIIAIIIASCAKNNKNYPDRVQETVFTPQTAMTGSDVITMVKLKTPALFTTAKVVNGIIKINQNELVKLKTEQDEFLSKVQEISNKIEVLYRYQYVLNGFALKTPKEFQEKIKGLTSVSQIQGVTEIAPPVEKISFEDIKESFEKNLNLEYGKTSVDFIGVDKVREKFDFYGESLEVGVLDTGIDYTHSMFKGAGTVEVFKSVDPKADAPKDLFPSEKVVGGIDLVGDNYIPQSKKEEQRLPRPDNNPIDISGHGTHVAGTVAGHGDQNISYDGVAPLAKLHAIKVFGGGSTGDYIVIAGFEYAADPNKDNDPSDALDVLNLSLGGAYGIPGNMYDSAIKNLSNVGIAVVASAGNSGDIRYITGAPGTSSDALSVGASIDNMNHNWKFNGVGFDSDKFDSTLVTSYAEATFSIGLSEIKELNGKLIYAGTAHEDFSTELNEKLSGNIALIDRGRVSFIEKVKRAKLANAIAVIVVNNQSGNAISMGGEFDKKFDIPAIMITKTDGEKIKDALKEFDVIADLKESQKIEKPELIDTLTGFSSRGPRSLDSSIKPEIVGPGQQIVSARVGSGNKISKLNGTSMSAPHLAGVMTLMKEAYPDVSVLNRKAILIGSALPISDSEGNLYPVSRQGAGRVQVLKAVEAKLFASPATLSLGEVNVKGGIELRKKVRLYNTSDKNIVLKSKLVKLNKLIVNSPKKVSIDANSFKEIMISIIIDGDKLDNVDEVDAILSFENKNKKLVIPMLAVAKKLSSIKATNLSILASPGADRNAAVELFLDNTSPHKGSALIFNKLLEDARRTPKQDLISLRNNFCDLQATGYRILNIKGNEYLEIATKTYGPQEIWNGCGPKVFIDSDGDGISDQELIGTMNRSFPGLLGAYSNLGGSDFQSILFDSKKAAAIIAKHEQEQSSGNTSSKLNLVPSLIGMNKFVKYDHSTVSIMRVDLSLLNKSNNGQISFKVALDSRDYEVNESDDFAGNEKIWTKLNLENADSPYKDIPEKFEIDGRSNKVIELTKGEGSGDLIIFYPQNRTTRSVVIKDSTQQIIKPIYKN